ncbi:MAG: hypothetical protein RMM58_02235 [Chloroflexota bacterium]|nr:hypothetical protein [Dehalococcoidia bacterium]MDW8252677.1 hypothetical protein [Chloroflexota bacterium]
MSNPESGYDIRLARPEDVPRLRQIRVTAANPEGKPGRKGFADAIDRGEVLVMERVDGRGEPELLGFIEWRSRTDGSVTIRDFGTVGDAPEPVIIKRLVREMLRSVPARPGEVTLKLRANLEPWTSIVQELPGFTVSEREFSRGVWWTIWVWTGEPPPRRPERASRRR